MSEKHQTPASHNKLTHGETDFGKEHLDALKNKYETEGNRVNDSEERVKSAQLEAEKQASETDKIKQLGDEGAGHERPHHYLTKSIKKGVYLQTLASTQTHLSKTQIKFSKFIHNDTIDRISDIGSKTVARPNAILGGGLIMVIGGIVVLFAARKYGFELPLSVYIVLYCIGFLAFIVVDLFGSYFKKITKK